MNPDVSGLKLLLYLVVATTPAVAMTHDTLPFLAAVVS